ncbi:hypothetical protein G8B09_24705 [Escherichia coli]|uniref:hypothetical protein n=1 Tax=Escherichia coli TaxID=562 RepID=UPI000B428DFB|nr:hypothetical protein [Escherichia coli]EHH7742659.1 hypothetical protein [Escherichia coli]EHN4673098.1 hypothetical protein [Escherichia coli]EHO7173067.1 hypothetical protein [Escherichia coli]EIP8029128.1 hypothetical protein [Escherichia coli]EKD5687525.1 hypothetical protein [Escherichia coli]
MNSEDKLIIKVDRLITHDSLNQQNILSDWERKFLLSILGIHRKINKYSLFGLSPKQKNATFDILKKHQFHID